MSYACEQMMKRGHNVLFVCPTNKLHCKYGANGCTINKFLGIGMTEESNMAKFDDARYDPIVFGEIFFSSTRKLAKIKRYCDDNPGNIILATGAAIQLESIYQITNTQDYDKYYNRCIDLIFPINMNFKEHKRLRDPTDREMPEDLKRDIFDESIHIETTVKTSFKLIQTMETIYNIAYRNNTCSSFNNDIRDKLLKKKVPFEVGETLICRGYFMMKKGGLPSELRV